MQYVHDRYTIYILCTAPCFIHHADSELNPSGQTMFVILSSALAGLVVILMVGVIAVLLVLLKKVQSFRHKTIK